MSSLGKRAALWTASVIASTAGFAVGCGGPSADSPNSPALARAGTESESETESAAAVEADAAADARAAFAVEMGDLDRTTDWPMFLGPHGTGVSNESGFADAWPKDGPPIVWSREIGTGYGAPSVRGDRLIIHHRVFDATSSDEIVECLDAGTGESLWKFAYPSRFRDPFGYNAGPRCSPLLSENHCFTLGAEGKLACVTLDKGEKVWMRDLQREFDLPDWFFGVGCSPILEDGKLIVLIGGRASSGVVAFDPATGKTLWKSVGRETWEGVATGWPHMPRYEWADGEQIVSYASPIAATIHGKRHLLCLMRQGLVSLDPADGRVRFAYFFRSRDPESVNAPRPLVIDDKVFITAAYGVGSALLKVDEDGDGFEVVWRDARNMLAHWSTPLHVDGHIYGFSGRHENEGELRCLDAKTGKVVWSTTGFEGDIGRLRFDERTGRPVDPAGDPIPFPFYGRGSKIRAGDKFIVLGERGTLALVKAAPAKWEELARTSYRQIGHPAWTAPVLSSGRLYLRDEDALICLELPKAAE
ncbi:MAG: PQQ-binding-like beta-propeller repeat protein [Planctomycetaceae bacterium]